MEKLDKQMYRNQFDMNLLCYVKVVVKESLLFLKFILPKALS